MIAAVGSGKRKNAPSVAPLIAQLNKLLIKNPKLQTCSDQLLHHLNQLCYNKQQKYIAKQADIVTTTVKQTLIKAIKITAQELLTQIKYNINQHRTTHLSPTWNPPALSFLRKSSSQNQRPRIQHRNLPRNQLQPLNQPQPWNQSQPKRPPLPTHCLKLPYTTKSGQGAAAASCSQRGTAESLAQASPGCGQPNFSSIYTTISVHG